MYKFNDFDLPECLLERLEKIGYTEPTPIQEKAIPIALDGRDVLGSAQTGTGKTAAFGLPMLAKLIENGQNRALILTPTRELAKQVIDVLKKFLDKKTKLDTALLIGGESMYKQLQALKKRPQLIVGTPGRVNDHLEQQTLQLATTHFLILDEMDRMLDMGFGVQIDAILRHMPEKRQTLMFSATIPPSIIKLSQKYLINPEHISIDAINKPIDNLTQTILRVSEENKFDTLTSQLQEHTEKEGSILIFVQTKRSADQLSFKLNRKGYQTKAIHGDLRQNQRARAIRGFRKKEYKILVATDVVARGLDIPHIDVVINYHLPECPEDYIHRIGRTARAGAKGEAICLVSSQDGFKWKTINRMLAGEEVKPLPFRRSKKSPLPRKSKNHRFSSRRPSFSKKESYTENNNSDRSQKRSNKKTPEAEKTFVKKKAKKKGFTGLKKVFVFKKHRKKAKPVAS